MSYYDKPNLSDRLMDGIAYCAPFAFVALIAALLLGIGAFIYDACFAESFSLRKDTWGCTASHVETSTTLVNYGNNVLVPVTSTDNVCDQWSRRR